MISYEETKNTIIQSLESETRLLVNIPVGTRKSLLVNKLVNHWTRTENKKVLIIVPFEIFRQPYNHLINKGNVEIAITNFLLSRKTINLESSFRPDIILLDEIGGTISLVEDKISGENQFSFSSFLNELMPHSTTSLVGLVTSPLPKSRGLFKIFDLSINEEISPSLPSKIQKIEALYSIKNEEYT